MSRWASKHPVEGVRTVSARGHAPSHGSDLPTSWASAPSLAERAPYAGLTCWRCGAGKTSFGAAY